MGWADQPSRSAAHPPLNGWSITPPNPRLCLPPLRAALPPSTSLSAPSTSLPFAPCLNDRQRSTRHTHLYGITPTDTSHRLNTVTAVSLLQPSSTGSDCPQRKVGHQIPCRHSISLSDLTPLPPYLGFPVPHPKLLRP
jgi:hypothetical protein